MSSNKTTTTKKNSDITWSKIGGLWASVVGVSIIFAFCWHENSIIFNLLALSGAIIGWLFGMLIVPLDDNEKKDFSVFIKIISGFVTGYLLSKIDPLLTSLLKVNSQTGIAMIAEKETAKQILITFCSFGVALLTVFGA